MKLKVSNTNSPAWRNITVSAEIPNELKALEEMSKNLWWVWSSRASASSATSTTTCGARSERTP